jgi:membrane-associated phospholipid phosphatase
MQSDLSSGASSFWQWFTRFGESGIVIPMAALLFICLLADARSLRPVRVWLLPLGVAVTVTTVSKIAFIGFGIGIAAIDFTGFSGHAMFSAAIYPVLAMTLLARAPVRWQVAGITLGYLFAVAVGVSRVVVGAHSTSEVVLGWLIGAAASGVAVIALDHMPRARFAGALTLVLAAWLWVAPQGPVLVPSHDMVTRLSLKLADRTTPYTRADLLSRRL